MDLEATMDETDVVVVDMGSGITKVGFCGEDAPRETFSTVVGYGVRPGGAGGSGGMMGGADAPGANQSLRREDTGGEATQSFHAGGGGVKGDEPVKKTVHFGDESYMAVSDANDLVYPIVRGALDMKNSQAQEVVELMYQHIFGNKMLNVDPEDQVVMVLDSPTADRASRDWLCELLFEKFKVKALSFFPTSVMSLFSTGKTRALVIDTGAGVTHAVPVGGAPVREEVEGRFLL